MGRQLYVQATFLNYYGEQRLRDTELLPKSKVAGITHAKLNHYKFY